MLCMVLTSILCYSATLQGSLTTGKPYGLKGDVGLVTNIPGDDWGLEVLTLAYQLVICLFLKYII